MSSHYLHRFFDPESVAVFGASERNDSVAAHVLSNLVQTGFKGPIFPINPKYNQVLGRPCFGHIGQVTSPVGLAVVATPANTVPGIIEQCGQHGVKAVLVLSAGFRDQDVEGKQLSQALLERSRRLGIRLLGPNCLGIIRTSTRLNATFSKAKPSQGRIALLSQSGALCTAILDWAAEQNLGFSTVISVGDALETGFGDLLDYLATDSETDSILMYVEGIRHARRFMSGLRAAARLKPVVVIKSGRHSEGARAAHSHTGAMVGSDQVFDAALRRAGAVRAHSIGELFAVAQLLDGAQRLQGNRLAIVTNAGGPAVMAADRGADLGIELSRFSIETVHKLKSQLPAHATVDNPVDVLGDATFEPYLAAVDACMKDPGVDGVLVMLTPQAMTCPASVAEALVARSGSYTKPWVTCWMGGPEVARARELFRANRVPTFTSPEASMEAFGHLANYRRNQRLLLEVPGPLSETSEPDKKGARLIIESALAQGRDTLTQTESKAVLKAFGVDTVVSILVRSAHEALVVAESLGFPVAMKVASPNISHKTDVGGVRLDIRDAEEVRSAFTAVVESVKKHAPSASIDGVTLERMHRARAGRELILGVVRDPVLGPAISFGAGGTLAEVIRDTAVALPPLNAFIVSDLVSRTRVAETLGSFRGLPPVNFAALERALLRLSDLVCELPEVVELDINPLLVDDEKAVALDARVVVRREAYARPRYAHMAIQPYPKDLVRRHQLADGTNLIVRPIRPEDAAEEQHFVRSLSEESRFFRFMQTLSELTPKMLARFTQIDYEAEMAFVAVSEADGRELGVARYLINPDGVSSEFALAVLDAWQGKGIGTRLMSALFDSARSMGLRTMEGEILRTNAPMLTLVSELGFSLMRVEEDPTIVRAVKLLAEGNR